jgi:hypothetical protein
MNASVEQPPSSPSELTAGAVALGVVALITLFGVSTSPPGDVSPSVASAAPPRRVAREPDNVPAEPARPSQATQASQASQPSQDGPASTASGTTLEIPIVTPPPPVSETQKRARTAGVPSIENSSPAPTSGPATDSLSESRAQALDILRSHDASPAQHQSRSAETTAAPRVEAFVGIWAREPAECRSRAADDLRIRIDARSAESGGGRCAFHSVRQEHADRWRVRASCNVALDSWTAHISLRMVGPNLRWSSERGTETYVRCPSPAGPVRQAGAAR